MSSLNCKKDTNTTDPGDKVCDDNGVPKEKEIPLPNFFAEAEKNVQLRLKFKLINTKDVSIRFKALIIVYHGLFLSYKKKFEEQLTF